MHFFKSNLRACLKIGSGPAAVDFGGGQGGEACASPQRADCLRAAHVNSRQLTGRGLGSQQAEPTLANAKRRAAGPLSIFRQALNHRLLGALAGLLAVSQMVCPAQSAVQVQLSPSAPGTAIAPDYVGLSFEMQRVLAGTNGAHYFSATNRALIATFQTLGIKNLRVGGNTADRPTLPIPTTDDVDNLFAFAQAAGVKVIFTLRLREGSLAAATQMANYITRHYAPLLDCFAIGNEPNVFSKEYAPYLAEWKIYAAQITAPTNSPGTTFCGPSTSPGHETWSRDFANEFGSHGPLAFIAQHDYPGGDARRATNAAVARDKILAAAMDDHYAKFASHFVPAALSNSLPYRLEEANSFYDGGAPDVSDTFASALWALNYQWWWAAHGASGINFHTGDKVAARDENKPCRYAVFWTTPNGYNIHPIGYALKLFSLGSQGRLVPATVTRADDLNLEVYAAAADGKGVCVTLINQEHGPGARAAEITLLPGLANAHGEVLLLSAPDGDIATKTGVTLGGAEILNDATWDGQWTPLPAATDGGKFTLHLPAASAALVRFSVK